MRVEGVVSTGIPELDSALGGGFLEGSTPMIVGEMYSNGWALGFEILRRMVERGFFGIIINYCGPVSLIRRYASVIGLDIDELGKRGDIAIIDVFGSSHGLEYEEPYIFSLDSVDAGTFLIKVSDIYIDILKEHGRQRTPFGLLVTLDGFSHLFGEEMALRILRRNLALREMRMMSRDHSPITLAILYRDRVSTGLLSWLVTYSEHVIELRPTRSARSERLIVRKSLLKDFEPVSGELRFGRGKVEVRIRKKEPELIPPGS